MFFKTAALASTAAVAALTLASCSSAESTDVASQAASPATQVLQIDAAFYPLQFVAEAVGAGHVSASSLTEPGVEPHDLELSPAQVDSMSHADLVLYIDGFQPAVDEAIASTGVAAFDAASVITLHPATEEEHEEGEEGEEHDHGAFDPHFWLEPDLLAQYAIAVGEQFATIDEANAEDYRANAAALSSELTDLNDAFATGLAQCERHDIVTSHAAFGYIGEAFGLTQHSITGVDPESEPTPEHLASLVEVIAETGATTVFTEALVSPKTAELVASEAGVETAVLDPIESVADGDTYVTVQERNLAALQAALGCK